MTSALIATGGTICWSDGQSRMLTGHELAKSAGVDFDSIVDVRSIPSWDMTISDMVDIALAVCSAIDDGHNAVTVTHGTDTMEETAWLTDLLLGVERRASSRVIFTGAMRFADADESDGVRNLVYARSQAEQTQLFNQGVQVAFSNELYAARWVRKTDAFALEAFSSEGRPISSGPLPFSPATIETGVRMVTVSAVNRQPIPKDASGIVLQGTGASHVPSTYFAEIDSLLDREIPVVLATRTRDVARTFRTSDRMLWAGDLSAEKATIALMTALGGSHEIERVHDWWSDLMTHPFR